MSRKRIGYVSPYLPPEIIWSCGLTPVRLRPGGSRAAADGYLPRNFSSEAASLLSAALEDRLFVDAVVFLDEDDTSRRLYDVWRAYATIPALDLVPLPRLEGGAARMCYDAALADAASYLSSLSGQPLAPTALGRAIEIYDDQRSLWRSLRSRWVEGDLPTLDWHDLRWLALSADPEQANSELAQAAARSPVARNTRGGPRLLALGSMEVSRQVLAFLEGHGARVVAEDSEADERTLSDPVCCADGNLLEALAAAYLAKPPGPRPAALGRRVALLDRLLDERCVQGVIAFYPKFADAYLAEYLALLDLFRARGLPSLLLEDDDESGFSGQQRTRVEAFLEVLA